MDAADISQITNWFDRLQILMKTNQIQPLDLYNFDEIGFLEGQGCAESVITQYPEKITYLASGFSWSLITIIECVSADGSSLPPCIILPGKSHLEDWYTQSNMPESWLIGTSSTGYTSDEIAFNWLCNFDLYSKKHQVSGIKKPKRS